MIYLLSRSAVFSPNAVHRDEAIFRAIQRQFIKHGEEVACYSEDELTADPTLLLEADSYGSPIIVSMGRDVRTLRILERLETMGFRVYNSPSSLLENSRLQIDAVMDEVGLGMKTLSEAADAETTAQEIGFPLWIKTARTSTQTADDVQYIASKESLERAIDTFLQRGCTEWMCCEHVEGDLIKFYGVDGKKTDLKTKEDTVSLRENVHKEEKQLIAHYAAGLVSDGDFIYLDAGTTTGYMLEFLPVPNVTYVTNAVAHAKRLALRGAQVRIIGGEVKATTEALVGNEAYLNLKMYHFSLGFFGTDGVDPDAGFTTPDVNESLIKQCAMEHCRKRFVVCDASKFGQIAPVTFGSFSSATILTDQLPQESYRKYQNIICVSDL